MKKTLILLAIILGMTAVDVSAQNEVRGVETKLVKYNGRDYSITDYFKEKTKVVDLWFGYSFYNMNSIPVSVDVELYKRYYNKEYSRYTEDLVNTKTFVLKSGESYIWKHENDYNFTVYGHIEDGEEVPKYEPGPKYNNGEISYYIKYKAYKLE